MSTIFLSYRRRDAEGITGRIFDRLERHHGADGVFMDAEDIPFGVNFREHIRSFIEQAAVVLAVIGPRWDALDDNGKRRLLSKKDWVRIEIETALFKGIPIVPVCVDGADIPKRLPKALEDFAFRQAAYIDSGRNFVADMDRLIREIDVIVQRRRFQSPIGESSVTNVAEFLAAKLKEIGNGHGREATSEKKKTNDRDPGLPRHEGPSQHNGKPGSATWSSLKGTAKKLARKAKRGNPAAPQTPPISEASTPPTAGPLKSNQPN